MAPRKGETADVKAARLTVRAESLKYQIDFQKAIASMKGRAEVVQAVKNHLTSLGYWIDDLNAAKAEKTDTTESPGKLRVKYETGTGDFDLTSDLHRNYNVWSSVPSRNLKVLLHELEPISLHEKMQKALCGPNQREPPREKLLELLEFACNVDPCTEVGSQRKLDDILATLKQRNSLLGRRAKEIRLPPDWQDIGIYKLQLAGDAVMLSGLGKLVKLAPSMLNGAPFDSLFIEANYSQNRATLRSNIDLVLQHACATLLAVAEPMHKKDEGNDALKAKTSSALATPTSTKTPPDMMAKPVEPPSDDAGVCPETLLDEPDEDEKETGDSAEPLVKRVRRAVKEEKDVARPKNKPKSAPIKAKSSIAKPEADIERSFKPAAPKRKATMSVKSTT